MNQQKLTLIICFIFLFPWLVYPQPEMDTGIRILSFNIRYNTPSDGINAWPNRKQAAADIFISEHIDIAGLQEALTGQIADLEEMLTDYEWFGVGRNDGHQGGEYCPIFYNKNRLKCLGNGTFWLSETPDSAGSKGWDAAYVRIVTWGKFIELQSDKPFYFFNTHFDHQGATARLQSARLLRLKIHEIAGEFPAILGGDFNALPESQVYSCITSGKKEKKQAILDDTYLRSENKASGPYWTFHGFGTVKPQIKIDYIFVTENINVKSHHHINVRPGGKYPSDHLPVFTRIVLPE